MASRTVDIEAPYPQVASFTSIGVVLGGSGAAALKNGQLAVDPGRVKEETTIWFDIDDGPMSGGIAQGAHAALDSRARVAFDHDATIGPRLVGLAILCAVLFGLATLVGFAAEAYAAPPGPPRIVKAPGTLVEIPASIPHEAGDMVDSRIVPDLRWLAARYPIFITDGYSGPLADGEHVGCDECHVESSDHLNGVAVDIIPTDPTSTCGPSWEPITTLALWAEPEAEKPVAPFRWVGYEGDAGHGCGNHLHLSWNHAPAKPFELAEWVEVFPVATGEARKPRRKRLPQGPRGGIRQVKTGGLGSAA